MRGLKGYYVLGLVISILGFVVGLDVAIESHEKIPLVCGIVMAGAFGYGVIVGIKGLRHIACQKTLAK